MCAVDFCELDGSVNELCKRDLAPVYIVRHAGVLRNSNDQNVNKLLGPYSAGNGLSKSIQLYLGSRCILPVGSCHFVQVCPLVGGCSLGYTVCVRDGLDESVYPGPKGF